MDVSMPVCEPASDPWNNFQIVHLDSNIYSVDFRKNYNSEHLQKSKDAAYKRRIRISGVMGFLGIMCVP